MRQLATRDLAGTDTLVTWSPEPTLFHTATYSGFILRAGLLRGDAMVGTEEVRWEGGAPAAFDVLWTSRGTTPIALHGKRAGDEILIGGSRDTTLAVPTLPWAIADYGMESLLTPLVEADTMIGERRVVVLRPYALKWDTLGVTVTRTGDALVVTTRPGSGEREVLVIAGHRLLWLRQPDTKAERRPLEGTSAFAEYTRLRAAVGESKGAQ